MKSNPSITLWAEDEVFFYQAASLIRKWSIKGQQPQVKSPPGRDKIGYFGMVNLTTGRLLTVFCKIKFLTFAIIIPQHPGGNFLLFH